MSHYLIHPLLRRLIIQTCPNLLTVLSAVLTRFSAFFARLLSSFGNAETQLRKTEKTHMSVKG